MSSFESIKVNYESATPSSLSSSVVSKWVLASQKGSLIDMVHLVHAGK